MLSREYERAPASLILSGLVLTVAAACFPGGSGRNVRAAKSDVQAVDLTVEQDGETRTVRVSVPVTIGRAATATLVLADGRVSRMHARIESSSGAIVLRDLGSRNGTLLNARPLEHPTPLVPGDEIDVGTMHLIYRGKRTWT